MIAIDSKTDLIVDPAFHRWADALNFPASRFSLQNPASLPCLAHSVLEQARDLWDSG